MINFHPSTQQIESFVAGVLEPAEALMVSAHCDMCKHCQALERQCTDDIATSSIDEVAESFDPAFDVMLANITQQPAAERASHFTRQRESAKPVSIELDGRVFQLPRSLQRYAGKIGNWSSLVGKLWQAPVDLGNEGVAYFIYMGKGGSVPEHTHRGSEMTLVLDGEFEDGVNRYDTGDFCCLNGENTHAPVATADEGCLVFTIVDQPLHFTSGIARLLNPFSHLFFR